MWRDRASALVSSEKKGVQHNMTHHQRLTGLDKCTVLWTWTFKFKVQYHTIILMHCASQFKCQSSPNNHGQELHILTQFHQDAFTKLSSLQFQLSLNTACNNLHFHLAVLIIQRSYHLDIAMSLAYWLKYFFCVTLTANTTAECPHFLLCMVYHQKLKIYLTFLQLLGELDRQL